jgi:hypothetical protein
VYALETTRLCIKSGNPIGESQTTTQILILRLMKLRHDGHWEQKFVNTIVENLFEQLDNQDNRHVLLKNIIIHQCTDKASTEDIIFGTASDG